MFIDGIEILSSEQLESVIQNLSEESKVSLRALFNNEVIINVPSQQDVDYQKYLKRGAAKDRIIAEMASENMQRIRSGIWTVSQLIELTQNSQLKDVLDDVNTLSFELAAMKLTTINIPLLTTEIKNGWIAKLQSHYYN